MKRWKRLFYYLFINVLISAGATYAVLRIWERNQYVEPLDIEILAQSTPIATKKVTTTTPSAFFTQLPLPTPTRTIQTYKVKLGDTLGEIAEEFNVSVEELIEYNGINDPNSLGVGQVLFIPSPIEEVLQIVTPTFQRTIIETKLQSVTPSEGIGGAQVEIASVVGAGDLESERVLLRGGGEGELILTHWQLQDDDGNAYVFPQITLFKDGAINLHTTAGMDTVVDLYWGLTVSIWESGDVVTLIDTDGNVRATYQVP